eukprot:3048110-Prymnesium_polylepis.1
MRERVRASVRVALGGDGAERRSVSPMLLLPGSDECRSLPRSENKADYIHTYTALPKSCSKCSKCGSIRIYSAVLAARRVDFTSG